MKTAIAINATTARVNNKHGEEILVNDDVLVLARSGDTKLMTITEITGTIIKVKNIVSTELFDNCPNHGKMEFVGTTGKKGKGKRYKCATCGAWATRIKSNKWCYGNTEGN